MVAPSVLHRNECRPRPSSPRAFHCRGLVEEKETGARDLMLCQNLQSWVLAAAWAVTYGVILAIVCAAVTIVCCTSFLRYTEPTLLLVSKFARASACLPQRALHYYAV